MKKIYIIFALILTQVVSAQITWTNGNNTNLWSDPLNWDIGQVPGPTDDVIFDNSANANCTMDLGITEMNNLTLNGYTGTLNANGSEVYIYGDYSQSSGTFDASNYIVGIFGTTGVTGGTFNGGSSDLYHGGSFSLSNGTYNASSANTNFEGSSFSRTSGTFNHNNGVFIINIAGTTGLSGTLVFNELQITPNSASPVLRTLNFGASITTSTITLNHLAKRFKYTGTLNVSDKMNIVSGTTGIPAGNTGIFNFNGANATIASSVSALNAFLGNVTINTAGVLSMSGNISVTGTWLHTSVGGFNSGTSTVTIGGSSASPGTVNAGTTTAGMAYFDNLSVPTGSALNLSSTAFINVGKDCIVTGTLNCQSSRLLLSGKLTHNGTYNTGTSILVFQGSGAQSINGSAATTSINTILVNSGVTTLAHSVVLLDSIKVTGGTFNGTNMTLRSTSTLKARIANITGGTLNGNITVQTFAAGGVTDWTVMGVSGISSRTFNDWYDDFPMAIEGSATGVTSAGGYFESVQGWIETDSYGYDTTVAVTDAITPGVGYWVFLGDNLSTTGNITIDVTGAPVTGNVIMPLSSSTQSGYNLLANPYASPISWAKLRNGNAAVNNAIYIYNPDLGITTSYVNGVSTPASASANDDIPMGQGFYVQCTSNTNLTAQESNKVPSNTGADPLLRGADVNTTNSTIGSIVRLNIDGGGYHDDAVVRFHTNATPAYDTELDANKHYESPGYVGYPGSWTKRTAIATQSNNKDYSINSLPYAHTQNAVIPVVAKVYTSGSYTISGTDLQNIPNNACISLFDKVTNITHDLRSGSYVCNINDTTNAARFVLTVCADITTDIKNQPAAASNNIGISKDMNGVFVAFDYDAPTDATISATNILGQTLMAPKKVKASKETMYLNIAGNDQLIFVTVETNNNRITKKILNK